MTLCIYAVETTNAGGHVWDYLNALIIEISRFKGLIISIIILRGGGGGLFEGVPLFRSFSVTTARKTCNYATKLP